MKKPRITLAAPQPIPLNKLILSNANVRTIKNGQSIEDLAADIARRGLLQNLNVRAVLDDDNQETGTYEVLAGGRRYEALQLLVKGKRLAKDASVSCVVRDSACAIEAEDDSLAENIQRESLHPLDQFRAFKALRDKGQSEEDIAAHFFVSTTVVKQRLRLAAVSENLLQIFADDGMTLEQLMAFTVSNDHARQEQVWDAVKETWNKRPDHIREMLTERTVHAADKRARFVGIKAYEEAGGTVIRDLFTEDHEGYLEDVGLLDRLVTDKLKTEAETIALEGWKWITVDIDFPHGHANKLRRLHGQEAELTAEQQAAYAALDAEHDRLEAEYQDADDVPEDVNTRLDEIENAMRAFEDRPLIFDPADIARAGVFVSIAHNGTLHVNRAFVRPEDEPAVQPIPAAGPHDAGQADETNAAPAGESGATAAAAPAVQRAVITVGGQPDDPDAEDDGLLKPLSERLVSELTAFRTLALRDAVANDPHVAMTALLHKLCIDTFHQHAFENCLQVTVVEVYFTNQPPGLAESAPATAGDARHKAWLAELPKTDTALWDWLDQLDAARRAALLAHCVSFGVNAINDKNDRAGPYGVTRRIAHADRLAHATGFDPVAYGWRPTVANYLGRVSKSRILAAVREAKGEPSAQLIDHLKKAEMAKEAERLLADTRWLPDPLRATEAVNADDAAGDHALPAFLTDDEDGEDGAGEGEYAEVERAAQD